MNPILPLKSFVPDGEPHVMPDGRLYLYGSYDRIDVMDYCSKVYHVFSTDDMENWIDHGESYRLDGNFPLYAPDAAHKDGKYYLYYCTGGEDGEYTAISDTPYGPFTDAQPVEHATHTGIDPSVFVDDDGQAYYFWGQFSLMGAKLKADMRSIDPDSIRYNILTEETHGFHEGSSIRKRNGIYYLIYCDVTRGRATCLSYAMAKNPLGPYTKGGIIIDNIYCDPQTWNNHGSIEEYKGQWYIFYHRSTRNSGCNRRACCEKIEFDENGLIKEVEMTTQGASAPIDAFRLLPACRACRMKGDAYIATDDVMDEKLTACHGSDRWPGWAEYKYLDFGTGAKKVRITARGKGTIHVCQEERSPYGEIHVDSEDFITYEADGNWQGGVHVMRLFFRGKDMEVRSIIFE